MLDSDLFARGMFWLKRKDFEVALKSLLQCYHRGYRKEEITKIILENCYAPHRNQFEQNYLRNIALLRNYPYIYNHEYPNFNELHYKFIPCPPYRYIVYDQKSEAFISDFDLNQQLDLSDCGPNDVIMIKNEFRLNNILAGEEKTRDPAPYLWAKIPLFLYYQDFEEFVEYLQIYDLSTPLETERPVFLFGKSELEQYYSEPQALFPKQILNVANEPNDDIVKYFMEKLAAIEMEARELEVMVGSYYSNLSNQELLTAIRSGKPRILFSCSRFTTAMQYYIRDCSLACDQLGIPNQILMEKTNHHRLSLYAWLRVINDFKPHIIFKIDHFRWELPFLPANIIHICWVQDILSNIASRESAARIGRLDFILNAFVSNVQFFLDFDYPPQAIIEAPVVANPHIYKKYTLTPEEKERYDADICAFSNTGNPQKGLEYLLMLINTSAIYEVVEKVFNLAYQDMYESFYHERIFYSLDEYRRFLLKYLAEFGVSIPDETVNIIAMQWRQEIGYRILRSIPLEWLHEKGYAMKLWGNEWTDHPLLADYAQGVAANGETLSRIINACKIVIGTNPGMTTHPRVGETMLSNSLYLAYRIPQENDWANIRRYLQEDKDIVFAYNRDDLYRKVDYYLENKLERRKMIRRARSKILKTLTYEKLINRILQEIAFKLEESGDGV